MIIGIPRYTERFGAVRINTVQSVYELDSGRAKTEPNHAVQCIDSKSMIDVERKMAIVVPVKNEKLKLLVGVVSGIPHECLVIVVSNSRRKHIDRFKMEVDALAQYNHFVQREMVAIHQKDLELANALKSCGYTDMIDSDGLVRDGKAEGMIVGMLLAKMAGKDYVGFVDADNYIPGAIHEYVQIFASGFLIARTPYSMVRISWAYKPKVSGKGLYFTKRGRVSEVSNKYLNMLISSCTGFGTDIIKTGNSGDHAISMALAELLDYSSGYSVEPYELVNIFEQFGGVEGTEREEVIDKGVEIFQIETRNPHIHESKGKEHLKKMMVGGLGSTYHSSICSEDSKRAIRQELVRRDLIEKFQEPPKPKRFPSIGKLDITQLTNTLQRNSETYTEIG